MLPPTCISDIYQAAKIWSSLPDNTLYMRTLPPRRVCIREKLIRKKSLNKLQNSSKIVFTLRSIHRVENKTHLDCGKPLKKDILFLNWNSDNHGQVLGQFCICGAFSHAPNSRTCLASPPTPSTFPLTMLDTWTCYFSRVSTLYWGGKGERILKRITVLF